jgi:transposase
MDEHRIGLKPVLRRVWTKRGRRPIAVVHHRYQWMYLNGLVQPLTGQTEWQAWSGVGTDIFSMVLADFARQVQAGPHKQVAVVLDRAGWHTSPEVQIPDGIHLIFLPPYSPELQPAERLWPLTNEAIANRNWPDLATLEAAQNARCLTLQADPAFIRRYTCYHWWPSASS